MEGGTLPLSKYFSGHGEAVMANMRRQYGSEKAKRVFYAMANARKDVDHEIGRTIKSIRRRHRISRAMGK